MRHRRKKSGMHRTRATQLTHTCHEAVTRTATRHAKHGVSACVAC